MDNIKMRKSVKVNGYHQNNFGDDLFFYILFKRYPNVDFYCNVPPQFYNKVFCGDNVYVDRFSKIFNKYTKMLKDTKLNYLVNRLLRHYYFKQHKLPNIPMTADVTLVGSWFMENSDDGKQAIKLADFELENKNYTLIKNDIPRFLLGANVGPVFSYDFLEKTKNDFAEFDDVCLRDKASYKLYSFMSNVRYAPDIVYNLDISKYKDVKENNEIIFNIIDLEWKIKDKQININYDVEEYYIKIGNIINEYIKRGFKINLVSFCENEGDERAIKRLKRYIEDTERVCEIFYNGNIEEILNVFAKSRYIICGRFHAIIMSSIFNKMFFPICYNNKMFNYLDDFDFKGSKVDIRNIDDFTYEIFNENLKNRYRINPSEHVKKANEQFMMLDKLLK